jgi:hypothetical protein
MSHALYSTRLYWGGSRGIAKLRGRELMLSAAPVLAGPSILMIDYAPEVRCAEILRYGEARRDMTADEIRAADHLLAELTKETPHG